jgi:hypothetical protein
MKEGRKSAIKLHTSQAFADAHVAELGKGHYIEHRPGISVKCIDYCDCACKCSFYKNLEADNENL